MEVYILFKTICKLKYNISPLQSSHAPNLLSNPWPLFSLIIIDVCVCICKYMSHLLGLFGVVCMYVLHPQIPVALTIHQGSFFCSR